MCLTSFKKFKVHRYYGWKVFRLSKAGLRPLYYGGTTIPEDEWVMDKANSPIVTDSNYVYPTGFHIYRRKSPAERIVDSHPAHLLLKKVLFRKVVAKGTERRPIPEEEVIVARQIFVPSVQ